MRKYIQPLLTFVRWCICHFEIGKRFTQWFHRTCRVCEMKRRCKLLQKVGWDILKHTGQVLNSANIEYYVEYGTLLGLYRDKSLIRHDDDVDYGVLYDSISPEALLDLMLDAGLSFCRAFMWDGRITELAFTYKGVPVDFFYLFNDENAPYSMSYNDFTYNDSGIYVAHKITKLLKPKFIGTQTYVVNGIGVRIPKNVETFLEYNYGKSWETPIKNFKADDDKLSKQRYEGEARIFLTESEVRDFLKNNEAKS